MFYIRQRYCVEGYSLLEVVVASLIFALGAQVLLTMLYSAQIFFKRAEHKSRVMRVALVKLEENLAKSYSQLTDSSSGTTDKVSWQVNITQKNPGATPFSLTIPYKLVEVTAAYAPAGKINAPESWLAKVENVVPSPFLHSLSTRIPGEAAKNIVIPFALANAPNRYQSIGPGLKLILRPETPQDVLVIYNIATKTNDSTGIMSDHTTYTGCFIDGAGPYPVETRTPIISQPLISNVVAVTDLAANLDHTIEIKYFKEADVGRVTLREADLMVIAFEKIKK